MALRFTERATYGQLNEPRMVYTKRMVEFSSLRLLSTEGQSEDWQEGEREAALTMAIVRLTADSTTKIVQLKANSLATFSLHALARFYQRAFSASDDTLISAIWSIMPNIKRLITTETVDEFGIPVQKAGGHWFGWINSVLHVDADQTVGDETDALNVRTFHADRNDSDLWVRRAGTTTWETLPKDD